MNRRKIINDPVFGFITFSSGLILDLIKHKYFQRLRRIKQLGLTEYVYPSAVHTRFHHALGATHLMSTTLDILKSKGIKISDKEYESAQVAILLHDIGHGPLSHTLENTLLANIEHEEISLLIMQKLNEEFDGALTTAINIFSNQYERKFFHQLVSGHFDMDRMDYLKRDSFYTGVSEGNVGVMRIINMLNVVDDQLAIEEKGIFNIENFLMVRRFMYWQVYLHKTTVAAEKMIENLFTRAKDLFKTNRKPQISKPLEGFIQSDISLSDFQNDKSLIDRFLELDDTDVWATIKTWVHSDDSILADLSGRVLNRQLFSIEMSPEPFTQERIKDIRLAIARQFGVDPEEAKYYASSGELYNSTYGDKHASINVLTSRGLVLLENLSNIPSVSDLGKIVRKYYLCYPKNVSL